jgi:uncharacterized membrane protein YczE
VTDRLLQRISNLVYVVATLALAILALVFIGIAFYDVIAQGLAGQTMVPALLNAVGWVIIAIAVFDVAKFLFEEEILRDRELRHSHEARKTLTKFVTIIVIATSLEAVVFIFRAGREAPDTLVYPTGLLAIVALLLASLGLYQRLSRSKEGESKS